MVNALVLRAPTAMSAPGAAPRIVHPLLKSGAIRRYLASTSTVAAGSVAQTLTDLTGSGATLSAATTGASPTMRESGAIRYLEFDGVNDRMDSSSGPTNAQPLTLMVVGRFQGANKAAQILTNLHANAGGRAISRTSGGFIQAGFPTGVTTTIAADNNWHVFTMVANGASSLAAMDSTSQTADFGTGAAGGMTLGRNGDGVTFDTINIAEIIVWPTALTPTERAAEIANLKAAHGIA